MAWARPPRGGAGRTADAAPLLSAPVEAELVSKPAPASSWSRTPAVKKQQQPEQQQQQPSGVVGTKGSIAASVLTILFSIPALVGSWCWPVLVLGILGGVASAGAKAFSHSLTFGITLAVMTNIAQMLWYKCRESGKYTHIGRFATFYLTCLAILLVMADPTRHVLQDAGIWGESSYMYRSGCNSDTLKCLSVIGVFFTVIFTYTGYGLLMFSVIWGTEVHVKIYNAWKAIREQQRQRAAAAASADASETTPVNV